MDNSRTATHWELRGYKRKAGRPRKNWVDVIKWDLRQMDLTWEEAEELANDKAEWHRRVAQCSHLHVDELRSKVRIWEHRGNTFASISTSLLYIRVIIMNEKWNWKLLCLCQLNACWRTGKFVTDSVPSAVHRAVKRWHTFAVDACFKSVLW